MQNEKLMLEKALKEAYKSKDDFMIEIIEDYFEFTSKNRIYNFKYVGDKFL